MLVNQFPNCCGVNNYHGFLDEGENKHYADDFGEDFVDMDGIKVKGPAFDLIILTEYQYSGAKSGLEKRGFKELGQRIRNENSGNYLVLLQRVNGRVKPPAKAKKVKPSAFKRDRVKA